jgi:basic membrane protein A
VKRSLRTILVSLVILAMAATMVVGCGGSTGNTTGGTTPPEPKLKAGMVTDIGGLGDKSFNDLSYAGLQKAEADLGVEIKAVSSKNMTDYDSNIAQLANAKFDVIFGIDIFLAAPAANEVGLLFKEQEAGYLAGVTAGLLTKDTAVDSRLNKENVIGFVGGMPIPPVQKFEAGFIAGAKSVNPDVVVKSVYSGSFTDQAKGKELGLSLISQKADIIFAAAGQSGIGAYQACKEKNALFIGVDSDQYLTLPTPGDTIITSAMKRVDVAVFETVKAVKDGTFKSGNNTFGLKEGGVDLAPWHDFESKVPQALKDAIEKAKAAIIDGSVVVPEDPKKA